jgi:MFS family permease
MIWSLATNAMIQSIGLGWAFRILAILACAVCSICTALIRDRNKAVGSIQMAFDFRLFKRPEFLLLLGWGFFSLLGYIVLLFSLPNYARSIGLSAQQGSVVGALLNLGQGEFVITYAWFICLYVLGIGRPFVGYFSDAAGRINMAATCTFLAGLFCLVIWIFAKNYGVLIFFSLVVGTVSGT